jgi:hypothetical protein
MVRRRSKKRPGKDMFAEVEPDLANELKKKLIDDGLNFRQWLELMIEVYLKFPGYVRKRVWFRDGGVYVMAEMPNRRKEIWHTKYGELS